MFTLEELKKMERAAQLELEGLQKLAEADRIMTGGTLVEGDPQPADQVILRLSDDNKEKALKALDDVSARLTDEALVKEAADIRSAIVKNAFVLEDADGSLSGYFEAGVVEAPKDPAVDAAGTDVSHELQNFIVNPSPYQKI